MSERTGRRRAGVTALLVSTVLAGGVAWVGISSRREPSAREPEELAETAPAIPAIPAELAERGRVHAAPLPAHVRWVAVGGGAEPESSQVSLEDDLALAAEVLGEGGVLLFAGGPGTRAVQVGDDPDRGDPLLRELGEVFAPRGGRDARYRETRLPVHAAATGHALREVLVPALAVPGETLTLWVATHGDRGERPGDAEALLWGGESLMPADLADVAAEAARPLRLVITSCFSGGFAELALDGLDAARGASSLPVCGFFATSWDEEASGCDPSPDRASHEAWSVHFLEALRGRDRAGNDVLTAIDLDGDGRASFAEASAYAAVEALSFDLPTTTSARLLRAVAPRSGPSEPVALREETSIVERIGARLAIRDEGDAQARLDALARRRVELDAAFEARSAEADQAWTELVAGLLSRWPVLDDPWHPDFSATVERSREAIVAYLARSEARRRWLDAQDDLRAMEGTLAGLRVQAAPLRRWLEAHETLGLAARLRARGGAEWMAFERMRACEAGTP